MLEFGGGHQMGNALQEVCVRERESEPERKLRQKPVTASDFLHNSVIFFVFCWFVVFSVLSFFCVSVSLRHCPCPCPCPCPRFLSSSPCPWPCACPCSRFLSSRLCPCPCPSAILSSVRVRVHVCVHVHVRDFCPRARVRVCGGVRGFVLETASVSKKMFFRAGRDLFALLFNLLSSSPCPCLRFCPRGVSVSRWNFSRCSGFRGSCPPVRVRVRTCVRKTCDRFQELCIKYFMEAALGAVREVYGTFCFLKRFCLKVHENADRQTNDDNHGSCRDNLV